MSVRNEPKIRGEMFHVERGQKQSMTPPTFPAGFEC